MLKTSFSLLLPFLATCSFLAADTIECQVLDFQTAIERLIDSSTTLKIAQLEIEVQNAQKWQDSLYPNPALTVEVDSFGGKHECHGFDSSEVSYSISQLILLGGKREARQRLDAANIYAAQWEYAIAEQDAILDL